MKGVLEMVFLDNYPKNSEVFVCLALDGRLFGFNRENETHTGLYNNLHDVWSAIDNPSTEWRPMP